MDINTTKFIITEQCNNDTLAIDVLLNGIPLFSEEYDSLRTMIIYKEKGQSILEYFIGKNARYGFLCCQLLDRVYKCICDSHDNNDNTCIYY